MPDPDLDLLVDGDGDAPRTLVLAHGAGAPMDSPFMAALARGVARDGIRVVRFEFPYMQARRQDGRKRAPDRQPVLLDAWRQVIATLGEPERLVIGGKSMGGRIATHVADAEGVLGLMALGYPFHPPGKPDQLRTAHLRELRTPALFVQGERDPFGTRAEAPDYRLSPAIRLVWLPDGDHSFKPRVRSGHTEQQNLAAAIDAVAAFVTGLER